MMNTYESFEEWYKSHSQKHRRIISRLSALVEKTAPQLTKISKWGNGCWAKGDLPLAYIHVKPDHLQFGFFAGAFLKDPTNVLRGSGKFIRHIRIETLSDIDEASIKDLVKKAVKAPAYK